MPYSPAGTINQYGFTGTTAANCDLGNYGFGPPILYGVDYGFTSATTATYTVLNEYIVASNIFYQHLYQSVQNNYVYGTYTVLDPETPEELKARQERQAAAEAKARETLERVLDDHQVQDLRTFQWFEVEVKGRLYRIKPGRKVEKLDPETKELVSFHCIHPEDYYLPADDIAISQKLWLETNESEFLRIANETRP